MSLGSAFCWWMQVQAVALLFPVVQGNKLCDTSAISCPKIEAPPFSLSPSPDLNLLPSSLVVTSGRTSSLEIQSSPTVDFVSCSKPEPSVAPYGYSPTPVLGSGSWPSASVCFPNPCHNGGTCSAAEEHLTERAWRADVSAGCWGFVGAVCSCPLGYTGMHCETVVDGCVGGDCVQNVELCSDGISDFWEDEECRDDDFSEDFCEGVIDPTPVSSTACDWSPAPLSSVSSSGLEPSPTSGFDSRSGQPGSSFLCEEPSSTLKSCPVLLAPANGEKNSSDSSSGSTVEFSCSDCYELEGYSQLVCLHNQSWSGEEPKCNLKSCPVLMTPTNGYINSSDTLCGATVAFSCDECYELKGYCELSCLPDQTWSGEEPSCVLKSCSALQVSPTNGKKNSSDGSCGTTVEFVCNDCYELNGSSQITCLSNQMWSDREPSCNLKYCPVITSPANGRKNSSDNTCGSTVEFTCDECYELDGYSEISCLPNQTWSEQPKCRLKFCPVLMTPINGEKNSTEEGCGSAVEVSCNDGFVLSGLSYRVCQANGSWNYPDVVCDDVNECLSSPCENAGHCNNTVGGFACICTAFYIGSRCETPAGNMYAYGTSQNDVSLPPLDDYSLGPISIPVSCFPFGLRRHRSVYIATNGLISFDGAFSSPYPRVFPGFTYTTVVAPFWSDVHTRRNESVFYNFYTDPSSSYVKRATQDVRNFSEHNSFMAKWVLVATWYRVSNYPDNSAFYSDPLSDRRNTYQVVIATDGRQTFALFNYPSDGLQWSGRDESAVVGLTSHDGSFFHTHYLSGFPEVINIATQQLSSNVGQVGRLFYQLSEDGNICERSSLCFDWYFNDIDREGNFPFWHFFLPPCPCSYFQVVRDMRYQWYLSTPTSSCYVSMFPAFSGAQTECCYSEPQWAGGFLLSASPQGGTANRYHSSFSASLHSEFDVVPHQYCCNHADLCHLYNERRPSQSCIGYDPPTWAWIWGDPHISTLDGKQYTFNGLGEYILMKTVNETFLLEGRTRLVKNSSATVISAFAAAQFEASGDFTQSLLESSVIHTELMNGNTLRVMACCYSMGDDLMSSASTLNGSSWRDITEDFSQLGNVSQLALDNVVLARPDDKTLVAAFSSGISVTVEAKKALLTVVLAAPDTLKGETRGLLGVWDDDLSNDLTARNGTVIHINSTDRDVHYLSQTWQVSESESLFYYESGNDVATFSQADHMPTFPDESLHLYTDEQRSACNNNPQCLFDTFETKDPEIGQETLGTNAQLLQQSAALMNFPPSIKGNNVVNATIGQSVTYRFVASDSDAFNVTVEGIPPPAADYTLTRSGDEFTFTWTPTSSATVSLLFIANDTTGLSSQLQPLVHLCACRLEKNARCVMAEGDGGTDGFILEDCECGSGWEGRFCGVDINACLTANCLEGTNCTDRAAPDTGFDCGSCSAGFEKVEGKCQDINDCGDDTLNNCDQVCVNQAPFFSCECYTGFTLDNNVNCSDINECSDGIPCHHVCKNVPGSFWCSCNSGFRLDTDNTTCKPEELCTVKAADCKQVCSRNGRTDVETCSCNPGYRLDSNNANCSDIDECSEMVGNCQQRCVNTNGSFTCHCNGGYRLDSDGRTCQDINECVENPKTCIITGQECSNLPGTYNCSCPLGTEVIDGSCRLANDCVSSPCLNDAECRDGVGMFACSCSSGYMGIVCDEQVDECHSNPCQNNGTCFDRFDGFGCGCVPGYEGTSCERETNECDSIPCLNGAMCLDFHLSFECQCSVGFSGILCETNIDECLCEPCENGAECADGVNNYTCNCLSGYIGLLCETDVDECGSSPCQNDGTCMDKVNGYECYCPSGYTGEMCESETDECESSPCQNSGNCTDLLAEYTCQCVEGYNGTNCEIDIDECTSNPCQNSGICLDHINFFECTCAGRFNGSLCEIEPTVTVPCSDGLLSSNCGDFVQCAEAAFSCSHSYFMGLLLSFCQLQNSTTTTTSWAASASSCLIEHIQEYFRLNFTTSPSPSECITFQRLIFQSQESCLNASLCSSNFSSVDADTVSEVFAMSGPLRNDNMEQMLRIIASCPGNGLNPLASSLKNEGFIICLAIELLPGENSSAAAASVRAELDDLIVDLAEGASNLTGVSADVCPFLTPETSRRRRSVGGSVEMMRVRRNADNVTDTPPTSAASTIQLAFVSSGENAISLSALCNSSSNVGNATLSCSVCGNGVLDVVDESCDDGNSVSGDGCSSQCVIESEFDCNTNVAPSDCIEKICGDGIRVSGEECDNGNGHGCSNCLIVQAFTCHVPFYERSMCFSCGNGLVEESEECDNGLSHQIDGCSNTCSIDHLWECMAVVGERSVCQHIAVNFNAADTLNPPSITFDADRVTFFVIEDPAQLDVGGFGDEDWQRIELQLAVPSSSSILFEEITYLRSKAASQGRISMSDYTALNNAIREEDGTVDIVYGVRQRRIVRLSKPASLTHVLLSLVYRHSASAVSGEFRYVNVTIVDIHGYKTPTVTVTLRYVGANDHSPVVTVEKNVTDLVEGVREVLVTSGSLTVSDLDSDFFPITFATVTLVGNSESFVYQRLKADVDHPSINVTYNRISGELSMVGDASAMEYQTALNSVVYSNTANDIGGLPFDYVLITLSVADGKNSAGVANVIVRLINVNDRPVLFLNGRLSGNMSFYEGGNPVSLPNNSVRITDSDNRRLAGATIKLLYKQTGDVVSVSTTGTGITCTHVSEIRLELSGLAAIEVYETVISSLTFSVALPRPSLVTDLVRLITLIVSDGTNTSGVVEINVSVVLLNDGPIVQFNPDADPDKFASLSDRSHAVGLIEKGQPLNVMPDTTTMRDVDSSNAGGSTVQLIDIMDGSRERLTLNETVAQTYAISVNRSISYTSFNISLSGIASFDVYRQVLRTLQYENQENVDPQEGFRTVIITLIDEQGAPSLPAIITVTVTRRNDPPELDVGAGFGVDDTMEFTEIAEGENAVGVHIMSLPHRVRIRDEEESTQNQFIQEMTIQLRPSGCGRLDAEEFVYLLQCPGPGFQCHFSHDGKSIRVSPEETLADAATVRRTLEDVLSSDAYYINLEDEPTVYCVNQANNTVNSNRFIDVTIVDGGTPSLNTTVSIRVIIRFINDVAPQMTLAASGGCEVLLADGNVAKSLYDDSIPSRKKRDSLEENYVAKREAPDVLFVTAAGGSLRSGSSVSIKFSHDTNMPPVLRPADLRRILTLNPPNLLKTSHMAFWRDPQTLSVFFPAINETEDQMVAFRRVSISFHGLKGDCQTTDMCEFGVCHADGWSCSVTGSYEVQQDTSSPQTDGYSVQTKRTSRLSANDVEQTELHTSFLFLLFTCVATAIAVVVAVRSRNRRASVAVKRQIIARQDQQQLMFYGSS